MIAPPPPLMSIRRSDLPQGKSNTNCECPSCVIAVHLIIRCDQSRGASVVVTTSHGSILVLVGPSNLETEGRANFDDSKVQLCFFKLVCENPSYLK